MNSAAIPEGPGPVAGAPHLPEGFSGTFTSRYVDTGDLRQHVVTGGDGPPLLLVPGWPQTWREDIYFGWQFAAKAARPLPDYAVRHYVGTLAADPGALHASFAIYRALDATIAQNQQRKTRRLKMPVLGIGGAKSLGEQVADAMKLAADDVQTLAIPGCGHHPPRRLPRPARSTHPRLAIP